MAYFWQTGGTTKRTATGTRPTSTTTTTTSPTKTGVNQPYNYTAGTFKPSQLMGETYRNAPATQATAAAQAQRDPYGYEYQAAVRAAKENLADQGLLSSTAAAGVMGQLAQAATQKGAEWNLAKQQSAFQQAMAQNQLVAQIWQNLMNYGLGKASLTGQNKYAQFYAPPGGTKWNQQLSLGYIPYAPGPEGDPYGGVSDAKGRTDSSQQWRASIAEQAASRAQQASQFGQEMALRQQQFKAAQDAMNAEKNAASDPWKNVWGELMNPEGAWATDLKPDIEGMQRSVDPASLLAAMSGASGIDIIREATVNKNPKAIAVLDFMFPNGSWKYRWGGADRPATKPVEKTGQMADSSKRYDPDPVVNWWKKLNALVGGSEGSSNYSSGF